MKIRFLLSGLLALAIIGCSTPMINTGQDFSDLEREYKPFSTKALSDPYVSRMFNKFLVVTPNPTQVIRQLEFARYLKDVRSDTTYFNSLKNIITNDSSIYTKITTTSGVPEKKSAEPASFGFFVDSLSPAPGVPVAISATGITANSFTANWNSVSGATSYIIVINGVETPLGNVTTYSKSALTGGTSYSYYVKAVNTGGTSSNSNTINVLTIPATPTANTASSITSTSFTANWSSVTGATGYKLTVDGTETDVANVTSKNITGLTAGTTHTYSVKAYNGSGTGDSSSTVTTVTVPASPVANPASAIASTSFTANWGTVTGTTGYKLFVGGIEVYSGTNTSFNVTGLNSNTIYTYYVRSINQNGTSTNSNTISTTTLSSVIATGLILSLDAGNTGSYPGTGTTWTDLSGNARNATLVNGASFNSSYSGGIVFDGSNDYAQYNIPYPRSMTVTTIAKSNSTSWNNYAGLGSARRQNGYILHNDAGSTQISFHFLDSSANYTPIGNCVPSNIQQPNFYTISTNGSNIHKIYLNGQLISTNTTSISRTSSPTSQPGILGRDDFENRYNSVTIYYHSIYDRQLSDSEVLQNYNNLKSRFGL